MFLLRLRATASSQDPENKGNDTRFLRGKPVPRGDIRSSRMDRTSVLRVPSRVVLSTAGEWVTAYLAGDELVVNVIAAAEIGPGRPGRLLSQGSHRSRRAQLRHLARHVTHSLR